MDLDTMVDTMVDTMDTLIMDTGAERREKLKLLLILRLIPGYTMDMDVDLHTMVLVDTIIHIVMDTGAERRGKLKLLLSLERRGKLKLLLSLKLLLILRLIPGIDMVIYMDIVHTMVILMLDTTGVNEEQDCNICKHLYMCTHLCSTHVHTKSTKDVVRLI